MVSEIYVVCPYCRKTHSKNKAIGTTGLINYGGGEISLVCEKCGKDFRCSYEVRIRYKTSKD